MVKTLLFNILIFLQIPAAVYAARIKIIPEPVEIQARTGVFHITSNTTIFLFAKNEQAAKTIADLVEKFNTASGIKLKVTNQGSPDSLQNSISITVGQLNNIPNKEGYIIDVTRQQVHLYAASPAGLFYAIVTLKQLLPVNFYSEAAKNRGVAWDLPAVHIMDYPRYNFRGMELDVSRHFFPAPFIKRYLDILAAYKINTFHWHLTDSHGWRLEIKRYPRLTSVGAWRADRTGIPMTIAAVTGKNEPATYGGFYTQEQVKEIVKYAADRYISIIPEIEMPGHCTAALVAYPQYGDLNNKTPLLMPCGYPGDLKHNFCVGYDSTYTFLENILKEVIQLFPSPYIHIGGDEVRGEPWLNCPRCQKLMKEKGFTTAIQLQAYFTRRIDSFIVANGKKTIGWEEILGENVSHQSVGMVWHEISGAVKAVKKDYDVVMTPYRYTYFDFYQSDPRLEKYITYAPLFLDSVYAFNPEPQGLTPAEASHILGGEACLWTENVETPERVEYMILPRMLAIAEDLWTPQSKKDYHWFINKVENELKTLDARHIAYATSMYNTGISPVFDDESKTIKVSLNEQTGGKYAVHYTINGTTPGIRSPVYRQPLNINKSLVLKTCLTNKYRVLGRVNIDTFTVNLATGASVKVLSLKTDTAALTSYPRLTDGIMGTIEPYDGRWVSISDTSTQIIIDLNKISSLHSIRMRCMEDQVSNIFAPKALYFSISGDGKIYHRVYSMINSKIPSKLFRHNINYSKAGLNTKARYVKIDLLNAEVNSGNTDNLVFLDEIIVN